MKLRQSNAIPLATGRARATAALAATLLLAAPQAWALYKVVGPDGSISYTDRPPAPANSTGSRVTPVSPAARGAAALGTQPPTTGADPTLPAELRLAVQRHPVTLYTTADCAPCDSGRKLLQQRGVPYSEKRIASEEDAAALEKIVGARSVPAMTVGVQPLRGLAVGDWMAFLDAAGYPTTNKLPRGWQPPAVTPLVARAAPPAAAGPSAAAPPATPTSPPANPDDTLETVPAGPRIRF